MTPSHVRASSQYLREADVLRGVVFDLDGTLILSHHDFPRMREAIIEHAVHAGAERSTLVVSEPLGTSQILEDAHDALRRVDATPEDLASFDREVSETLGRIEMEAISRTTERPGARALLRDLRAHGLSVGVFTRSSLPFSTRALRRCSLEGLFTHLRTRDDPGPLKPDPRALGALLKEMQVQASEALCVGDHPDDGRCAGGLGVEFWAVLPGPGSPAGFVASDFEALAATLVAPNLRVLRRQFHRRLREAR